MTDQQYATEDIDLTPFVHLSKASTEATDYSLEIVFRQGTFCHRHDVLDAAAMQRMSFDYPCDYVIECELRGLNDDDNDNGEPLTISLTETGNLGNGGRILVWGKPMSNESGNDTVTYEHGPKGDPKTVIRFEDAVVR